MKTKPLMLLIILILPIFLVFNIQKVNAPSPFTTLNAFGNWSYDSTNKILTIVANATANAGNTEANAYGFQDIVNAIGLKGWTTAYYNRSYSGKQFELGFRIVVGDGSTTTWFVDFSKQITWTSTSVTGADQKLFDVKNNAYVKIGVLETLSEKSSSRGIHFISLITSYHFYFFDTLGSNSYLYIYSSIFDNAKADWNLGRIRGGNLRVWNTLLTKQTLLSTTGAYTTDLFNIIIEKVGTGLESFSTTTSYDKISFTNMDKAVYTGWGGTFTVSNIYVRQCIYMASLNDWVGFNGYIINADSNTWTLKWNGASTTKLFRQYEFDLTTTANSTIVITYYGQGGGTIYNQTDLDGVIPTQTITKGFYNQVNGNTIQSYEPFNLKISKDNYQTYEGNFTLSEKTNWNIQLQELQESNVEETNILTALSMFALICSVIGVAVFAKRR